MHLNDDDLVLHYYGEMDAAEETRASAHLSECGPCHGSYTKLQRVLAAVEAAPAPEIADGFERIVWARLEPDLRSARTGWLLWFVFSPARMAWLAGVLVLLAGAFVAGRHWKEGAGSGAVTAAATAGLRERVLLVDLSEHLDRSQMILIELVSAGGDGGVDMTSERARAEQLVTANRLYRQTAAATGNQGVADVLDELERVLVDVAASPERLSASDLDEVRRRIETKELLFKVRVLSTEVRERQKTEIRTRTGQSS